MATKVCTEPGMYLDERESREKRGDGYVVEAGPTDDIKFPGVDSCLAIAVTLSNGWMIGGHVGAYWPPNEKENPMGYAQRILGEMLARPVCRQGSIKRVIFVGDPVWWIGSAAQNLPIVVPSLAMPAAALAARMNWHKGEGTGLDIWIKGRMGDRTISARCHKCDLLLYQEPLGAYLRHSPRLLPDHNC